MHIAIIGTGNVGGTLATKWAQKGHTILLGVNDRENFKGKHLLNNPNTSVHTLSDAVKNAAVILLATPAKATIPVTQSLGDTSGKIIIDAMKIVMKKGPEGFSNTTDAILAHTQTTDVVKCFNTTGYHNMENTQYGNWEIDAFVAGNSEKGKQGAIQLAKGAGFAECYDVGGNDQFTLMELFALFWINLALLRGLGREIAFKLLKR
jgi:predicted dinucleotide-binding enzyme